MNELSVPFGSNSALLATFFSSKLAPPGLCIRDWCTGNLRCQAGKAFSIKALRARAIAATLLTMLQSQTPDFIFLMG